MVYCIVRVRNVGFTLLIMVLLLNKTSGNTTFTCWKLEKPLLQITLLVALFFREYYYTYQQFLTDTNQCEIKDVSFQW